MVLSLFSILAMTILAADVFSKFYGGRIAWKFITAIIAAVVTVLFFTKAGILPYGLGNETNLTKVFSFITMQPITVAVPQKDNTFVPEALQNLTNPSMMETYTKTYKTYWQGS